MTSAPLQQDKALEFMLAGKAIMTFKSTTTGTRFTYKITQSSKNKDIFFVGLMNSSDNTCFAPMLYFRFPADRLSLPTFMRNTKSWISEDAPSFRMFIWVFKRLMVEMHINNLEIWHEGRCCRCGKLLTVPESVELGIGPECIKKELKFAI